MNTENNQPEVQKGNIGALKAIPQISLLALGFYNFFFILLTLHAPYIFLYTQPNLVMTARGLEYDMGGIFPHLGAIMIAFTLQTGLAIMLTSTVGILRRLFRNIDAFSISFYSICGLQMLVYYQIYFPGKTDPAILRAFGSFTISRALLAVFIIGSLLKIYAKTLIIKPAASENIQTD